LRGARGDFRSARWDYVFPVVFKFQDAALGAGQSQSVFSGWDFLAKNAAVSKAIFADGAQERGLPDERCQ
jgi:hypothetical protein